MRRHRSPTCSPTPAASAASTQTSSWSPPPYPYPHPAFPPLSATPRLTLAVGFVTVAAAAPPSPRGGGGVLSVQIGGAAAAVLRGVISPEQQPRMPGAGAGVQAPEASPGRYVRRHDEVTPDDDGCDDVFRVAVRGPGDDPFDIPAKRAPVERLRRWRQAALVLNASRRFRYS
ncbi:uncharacterized protein [Lolium perenne]|uniref:uncharacterized protein isoform X2 n=1 Tax=Lolium perenne TaxID=4522 RepID=UPI003A99422A